MEINEKKKRDHNLSSSRPPKPSTTTKISITNEIKNGHQKRMLYSFQSGDVDVVSSNYTHLITDCSRH